ncbi:MAG TPA: DUF4097 family beta strand repeat-containing protein [Verrucomicrobiae bacterium]|nr:DUF4097 family beta strand repeat-containing protein [Verrucomicrobiae bacterium]
MATTWRRGLAGLLSVFAFLAGTGLRAHAATTLIPTTAAPFVVVQLDSGSVNIRTWDRPAIALAADPTVTYNHAPPRQVADRVPQQIPLWSQTIKTAQGEQLSLAPELFPLPPFAPGEHDALVIRGEGDVTLTVPQQSPLLLINVRLGSVTLSGYSGTAFVAHVVAGEVHMDNDATTAAVQVNNGSVFISNSNFTRLRLRTGRGNIFMSGCRAQQIQVTSLIGSIVYDNGIFDPGLAHFETDRGSIAIGAQSGVQIEAHSGNGRILYDIGTDGSVNRSAQDAQATLMGGGPVVTASTLDGAVIFFRGSLRDYPQFERLLAPRLRGPQSQQAPLRQPTRRLKIRGRYAD